MKKLLSLMLVLCMLLSVLPGFASDVAPLTVDEVAAYLETLREQAMQDETLTVVPDVDGSYSAAFSGGLLKLADDALRADSAIVGARLSGGAEDLRQLRCAVQESESTQGSTLQDILDAYPCANRELYGTYEEAVVMMTGSLPGSAMVGVAERMGQKVEKITYYAYETVGSDTVRAEVIYYVTENYLLGVEVVGGRVVENSEQELSAFALLQEEMDYRMYPVSEDGSELEMFAREDLLFSGVDFLTLTAEELADRFGEMVEDRFVQDTDGTYIRTCRWDGIELVLKYDADKMYEGVSTLYVSTPLMEGPRGACTGDTVTSLMLRFRHGEGEFDGNATVLYGENGAAPYGEVSYVDQGAYLMYVTQVPDGQVALYFNCPGMTLDSYMLAVLDGE